MPGLLHDPGQGAGYKAGQNAMQMVVDHDTGGTNSYGVCKMGRPGYRTGLCQILLPKEGVPWQFTEIDAVCYHAGSTQYGDYNGSGPGLEVERFHDEELTDDQAHWLGEINRWLESEWGIPNVHYWGPQFPWHQADFHGHVNHSDIHPNPDGLTPEEWDRITEGDIMPSVEEIVDALVKPRELGGQTIPSPIEAVLLKYHDSLVAPVRGFDGKVTRLIDWIGLSNYVTIKGVVAEALASVPGGDGVNADTLAEAVVTKLAKRLEE